MRSNPVLRARLVALLFLGSLLLNFPILSLASRKLFVGGIPVLFVYGFSIWALLILLIALAAESKMQRGATHTKEPIRQPRQPSEAQDPST